MRRARPLLAAAVRDVGVRAGNRLSGGGSGLPALQMPGEQEEGCLATLAPGSSGPLPRLRCDGHNHRGSCRANHRHCGSLARGVLWPSATAYGQCRNIGATSTSPRLASPTTSPLHPLGVVPRHTPFYPQNVNLRTVTPQKVGTFTPSFVVLFIQSNPVRNRHRRGKAIEHCIFLWVVVGHACRRPISGML